MQMWSRNRCKELKAFIVWSISILFCSLFVSLASAQEHSVPYFDKESNLDKRDHGTTLELNRVEPTLVGAEEQVMPGPRQITLDEAQKQAEAAAAPMKRLAELQVEVARQHRLGAQADYFPKVGSTLTNLHFNKFMGELIGIQRPVLLPNVTSIAVPLLNKDLTVVGVTAVQPLTSLLKVREAVRIAKADENVARAKAGMPVVEIVGNVEKAYFELLVAQRRMSLAELTVKKLENRHVVVSLSVIAAGLDRHKSDLIQATEILASATAKVKDLTASLNDMLGWPSHQELILAPPPPFTERISLDVATAQAMNKNPEVVEAEQNLVKARAASKLSKLEYIPDVAAVGGYAYQNGVPLLPNDFSWIGVMGSYNLFDFGKREHKVKEAKAQVELAETALQLTKAKVAAGVNTSYFELERMRRVRERAQRLVSETRLLNVGYMSDTQDAAVTKAELEAEMFQADLEYRQAFARLVALIGYNE